MRRISISISNTLVKSISARRVSKLFLCFVLYFRENEWNMLYVCSGVLLGAERFMASWHKSEEEASKLREVNRAA